MMNLFLQGACRSDAIAHFACIGPYHMLDNKNAIGAVVYERSTQI